MKKNFLALWHNEIARYRYFIGAVALSSVYLRFGGALWELSFAENIFQTIGCPRFISILAVGIFDSIVTLCLWFSIMVCASFFMARQKGSFQYFMSSYIDFCIYRHVSICDRCRRYVR